ncbi:MAG: hypothetical protein AAF126_12585 [Chloroflexota bacterium]
MGIVTIAALIMALRAIFVVAGVYKDPVLATFEVYGEERFFSPLLMLITWVGAFAYVFLYWYLDPTVLFTIGMILLFPIIGLHQPILKFVSRHPEFFEQYPRWYQQLLDVTDRDERRRIAYLWLFLPPATRMIYNVNTPSFMHWMEQVLLTVNQNP